MNRLVRRFQKEAVPAAKLYFEAHNYQWFEEQNWEFKLKIKVWRSVGVDFLKRYIHTGFKGKYILEVLYSLEEKFPHFFGRYGAYPIIVIEK